MYLNSERLTLRPVTASDAEELFRIYGDPATNTFNPAGPYPNLAHAQNVLHRWLLHWEEKNFGNWAISLTDEPDRVIGFGGLAVSTYAGDTINSLGYRFDTKAWGKGLATELSLFSVRYGFEVLNLDEISAVVRGNHTASQNVLTKAGLLYIKEIHDVENAPPSLLYSLTYPVWRQSAPAGRLNAMK